ncbi:MAG: site-specific integrase [Vicinamibacterales bacterium]
MRKNLDVIAKRHIETFREAQEEAQRAIVAWLDKRDPTKLQPSDRPTLEKVLTEYFARPDAAAGDELQRGPIERAVVGGRPFGSWRAEDITRETLDQFRATRPKVAGNRNLALLRAMFNWAVAGGLMTRTPFRVGHVSVVRLSREESRTRRLQAGEEEQLLLKAKGRLRDLIVAALASGCRRGELLGLQWRDVRAQELVLPATKTKARRDRRIPISSALRGVLDARRNDPDGKALPPEAFVFGDELGRRIGSFKTAWKAALKAAAIKDLRFHDLRREAGSRWMDAGIPLATIQRWLGHSNIAQTSKYLAASLGGDESALMRAFEERTGRLPHVAISAGSTGIEPTQSSIDAAENANKDTVIH